MLPQDTSTSEQPQGRWQVTLRELLLSSWVTGLLMLISSAICPQEFRTAGVIFALVLGLYFAAAVMINARRGHELSFMRMSGALGIILIVGSCATILLSLDQLTAVHHEHRQSGGLASDEPSYGWGWLALFGVAALATGVFLIWFAAGYLAAPKRSHRESEETLRRLLDVKKTAQR